MGAGQCCSTDSRCCAGSGGRENVGDFGGAAPVGAQPLPSNELMGIDNMPAPGMDTKTEIAAASTNSKENKEPPCKGATETPAVEGTTDAKQEVVDVCPGGDSAAGGVVGADKQEYQYVTYEDGSTYIGQISDGKRQGHGIWQSRTGQYEGQWKADAQHGKGRQTWSDGRVYDGQFHCGRFSGSGRMVWHTQKGMLIYEGQYQDDLKHGEGKFVWADGRTYNGEWQKGKRHGRGMYMNAKCERKIGYWIDDKFERWENPPAEEGAAAAAPAAPATTPAPAAAAAAPAPAAAAAPAAAPAATTS